MTSINNPINGVLVLAGLLDPVGDIGTQCRYDLLPIPWYKNKFISCVSNMIRFDLDEKARIEYQITLHPEDSSDTEALLRGVGLRAWLKTDITSQPLKQLITHGWSETRGILAGNEIDLLSFYVEPIIYKWPHLTPDDEIAINQFEFILLNQLESVE